MLKMLRDLFTCCNTASDDYNNLDAKIEKKMIEDGRNKEPRVNRFRSINGIIMRFPQFKEELQKLSATFEQFDNDSNGIIDGKELSDGLRQSDLNLSEQETDDLLHSCDLDGKGGVHFNEFIVLFMLLYFLAKPSGSSVVVKTLPGVECAELEGTFDSIIEAFLFMDKTCDGKLNKGDMFKAMEEVPWEKSPAYLTKTRFKEMDRNKNGTVTFREFLFALTSWLGFDIHDEVYVFGD